MSPKELDLGTTLSGKDYWIEERARATHMHVIGASGRGKSKFLEHLIREDITEGRGVCVIDPHGYLYRDLLAWCESVDYIKPDRIQLFDPSSEEWTFGFNPLSFDESDDFAYCVDSMVKACAQVWGGEDTSKTPLLKRCLRATFHALAEKGHTMLESSYLTNEVDVDDIRRYLTSELRDYIFADQWAMFNRLGVKSPREFREYFLSTNNRLMEFLAAERIRRMIGQKEKALDIRSIMDEGKVLLVNLSTGGKLSDDNARLLGTLLVNDLFLKARRRAPGSQPFYLYIDECALFVNEDIGRILDEARKFGLHLILAHQHLAQLREAGEKVYFAVMTNAQTKVVFGGLTPDDAREMTMIVHMGELDLEDPKERFNKMVVVDYIDRWFEGEGISESTVQAIARGEVASAAFASSYGAAMPAGMQVIPGGTGAETSMTIPIGPTDVESESSMHGEARSKVATEASGRVASRVLHQAQVPVLEEQPTAPKSLDEKIYESMAVMINQPSKQALVKIPGRHSAEITVMTVEEPWAYEESVVAFEKERLEATPFAHPIKEIDEILIERRERLKEEARDYLEAVADSEEDYWG